MRRLFGSIIAVGLVGQLLAATALAAGPGPFKGLWTSTDTDGSTQMLSVSGGATPSVVFQDFYASVCDRFGGPSTHWVSAGTGEVDGDDLVVGFHKSGCGSFSIGAYVDLWTYQPGSDTLIDTAGIVWSRMP
jgi:hypothetical protein